MSNYSTDLKDWGSAGNAWPDNYYYVEGEAPVDAWDNFFNQNVEKDINHLISLTNSRIESAYGAATNKPASPEDGEQYWDTDNDVLEVYDGTLGSWKDLAWGADLRSHEATTGNPHSTTLEEARSASNSLAGAVDFGGNDANNLNTVEFNSDDVRVTHGARTLEIEEYNSTDAVWTSRLSVDNTGVDVTGDGYITGNLTVDGTITSGDSNYGGSDILDVGTIKFSDSDGGADQWTLTENATSGNLEAALAGTTVLDVGSATTNVSSTLQEQGNRVATRVWTGNNYVDVAGDTMSGILDMNQNEVDNFVLDKRSTDPTSPVVGQMWYRTDLD